MRLRPEGGRVARILDLGTGTGETARRVLARHPSALLVGVDESPPMLEHARTFLPEADLRAGRLEDALPEGQFDLVVSALAVHHLETAAKRDLFERVYRSLSPGGRFALADLVVPDDPANAITPIDGVYDRPDRLDQHLGSLTAAGSTRPSSGSNTTSSYSSPASAPDPLPAFRDY